MDLHRVLILNTGSSSLKWTLLDGASERVEAEDDVSWEHSGDGGDGGRHTDEIRATLARVPRPDAVGHRVVHGGALFREAVVVDQQVREGIASLADLAPLHNPAALAGIDAVSAAMPGVPQVAAFDTAFHAPIPDAAAIYPLPREWTERYGLRRFGFHGLSVAYTARRSQEMLGTVPRRMVVCHLGSGCSLTAVAEGRSVDTSMGFTPLEGVMMATRSGSLDPGLLLYLLTKQGLAAPDLYTALDKRAGLLGVSGVSADLRKVLAAVETGNRDAELAVAMFTHSVVRMAGAMIAVLGDLDALVFTGGIGEHSAPVRRDVAARLGYTGLTLDEAANDRDGDRDIAQLNSPVRALVIHAREDLSVLTEVRRLLG